MGVEAKSLTGVPSPHSGEGAVSNTHEITAKTAPANGIASPRLTCFPVTGATPSVLLEFVPSARAWNNHVKKSNKHHIPHHTTHNVTKASGPYRIRVNNK